MNILIVDDEKNVRDSIRQYLSISGFETSEAQNGLSAQRMMQEAVYAAVVLDLKMPGMSGLDLLTWMRDESIKTPVIMISAHGEVSDAVEAIKLGASDYLVKPFDPDELVIRIQRVVESSLLRANAEVAPESLGSGTQLIGSGQAMTQIRDMITKVAPTPATVLITGESGVGKEVVARLIHSCSNVADGPFVAINLGAIPDTLLESELFGHEKGAFTGAIAQKSGMFELASGGTVFLDEIGEMPLHLQVKLLRVLQERKIQRVGGTRTIPVDGRPIAATNRDIRLMVKDGTFREDLYYRLNIVNIEIPPLQSRLEDLPPLAAFLLNRHARRMGRQIEGFSADALRKLRMYNWPGNIRELENVIERAVIFAQGSEIEAVDLSVPVDPADRPRTPLKKLRQAELDLIAEALHIWEGNRTKAAESLGITRRTLFNKIKEYGLDD